MNGILELKWVVILTTTVAVVYLLGLLLGVDFALVCVLYLLSLSTCIWMVLHILKEPYTTDKSFEDYFYMDRPDIRRVGKE